MQQEQYAAMIDELLGTPVEAVMFCLGEGRTMLHDTKVGELLGHNMEKWNHIVFRRAYQNAKSLIDAGHDPLRIVCDRAHEKGLLLYPTLLMQLGGAEWASDRCSDFRKNNKHLEIRESGELNADFPFPDGLDFKHEEVRAERLEIIEEVLTDYSVDGLELQLNMMPHYFHPDEVGFGIGIMTDYMGRIHEAVKKSASDRELVMRIPCGIEDCLSVGLDVEEWVRQGIVDVIVGEFFADQYVAKPHADYRPLLTLTKGTNCRVHAVLNNTVFSDRLLETPITMTRAMACNFWAQGVEGLYLAQWFQSWPYQASFYEKLREVHDPDIMETKDKFYHVPSRASVVPGTTPMPLPADLNVGEPTSITFLVSDDLTRWGAVDRVHEVLLRFRVVQHTELDSLRFCLNGQELPAAVERRINEVYKMKAPRHRVIFGYWHVFRLSPDLWPVQGENTVEVTLLERDPDLVVDHCSLNDIEMEIKYLLGKNFERGFVDEDLGPFEHAAT